MSKVLQLVLVSVLVVLSISSSGCGPQYSESDLASNPQQFAQRQEVRSEQQVVSKNSSEAHAPEIESRQNEELSVSPKKKLRNPKFDPTENVHPDLRIWTATTGDKVEAVYQRVSYAKVAQLTKTDGSKIEVDLESLNDTDLKYVTDQKPVSDQTPTNHRQWDLDETTDAWFIGLRDRQRVTLRADSGEINIFFKDLSEVDKSYVAGKTTYKITVSEEGAKNRLEKAERDDAANRKTVEPQKRQAVQSNSPSTLTRSPDPYVYHSRDYSPRSSVAIGRVIHTGPRGGRFYYNSKGNKTYVKR